MIFFKFGHFLTLNLTSLLTSELITKWQLNIAYVFPMFFSFGGLGSQAQIHS